MYSKEASLHIIGAIFLVTPCPNKNWTVDENYQACALSTLEGKDESSWSPIEKPSISFPFRNQRVATILQSKKLILLHKSAHFAYWGFVWALLSSSRYMQFNMAGLEQNSVKRIKGQRALTWHSSRCQARCDRRPHRHLWCEDRRTEKFGIWSGVFFLTPWNLSWMKHYKKLV